MVNKRIIAARLERLQEYLTNLEAVQQFDCKRFVDDPFVHGTAERNLHLAIECLLDIGNHIIVDRNYSKPESYADIFKILSDEQVISQDLFDNLEGMAAFRNILVHDYMRLDRKRVYEIIKLNTCYLKDLGTVFAALL